MTLVFTEPHCTLHKCISYNTVLHLSLVLGSKISRWVIYSRFLAMSEEQQQELLLQREQEKLEEQ